MLFLERARDGPIRSTNRVDAQPTYLAHDDGRGGEHDGTNERAHSNFRSYTESDGGTIFRA